MISPSPYLFQPMHAFGVDDEWLSDPGPIPNPVPALGYSRQALLDHFCVAPKYASPGAAEYYRRNGKFADGTVLVKQVFGTDHAQLSTGNANWAADTKVWFVLIKDAKGRYLNNPLWGDGWGWALFKSDAPDKQVATDYKKDCLGCHVPAKADDWIYVKGYPILHSQ